MELKEYIQIIKKHLKLFICTAVIIILSAFAYFSFRPVSYTTSLVMNITRSGAQNTDNYKYDDFYRLQADEKFAETLVEWLKSPRIEEEILKEAGIDASSYSLKKLAKNIKAEKKSSQVVAASFSAQNKKNSENMAQAVSKIISQKTENLNKDQKDSAWFHVIFENPVIRIDEVSFLTSVLVFFGAVFTAFWIVMIKHYLE
ncbi:MAG TPA: Wzz/FepE/Etk N-terminal domain-containing protein [Candidatus Moranbacteria bacterium]|nr:Wzz/FepE/Etk N-terminal domain-containing protein [Candidatus Moranbacteria bacterium]